jgi:glycosyltransferase involved in cell wall biosynthesis
MVRKKRLVSIIIPTHNRLTTLLRAVKSALNQTYQHIEVIIVDDASKISPENEIRKLQDPRIQFFRMERNVGAPVTRNFGIKQAKGEYVNFLDDDDLLLPRKIELQLEQFAKSKIKNLGVVTCDVLYQRSDISGVKKNRKKGNIQRDLLRSYCVFGTETMLIKRKYLLPFDNRLQSNQEYDLAIRLARQCSFDYVAEVLTKKYQTEGQISFDFDKKIAGTRMLWKLHKKEFKEHKILLYNYFRFSYLLCKYTVGKYIGKRMYSLLP